MEMGNYPNKSQQREFHPTINGNYLRVNTNGSNSDLTIPYATNSNYANSAGSVNWANISGKQISDVHGLYSQYLTSEITANGSNVTVLSQQESFTGGKYLITGSLYCMMPSGGSGHIIVTIGSNSIETVVSSYGNWVYVPIVSYMDVAAGKQAFSLIIRGTSNIAFRVGAYNTIMVTATRIVLS